MQGGFVRILLAASACACLLPISFCRAQVLKPQWARAVLPKQQVLLKKEIIERHFESLEPRPRPAFQGAIPGARLLSDHRLRGAMLDRRSLASQSVDAQAASGSATLPGIMLRPALGAGSIPTAVITGDFNGDGHMDFIVANGLTNDLWLYLGKGDGTFQLPRIIPLSKGLSPVGLATASLRGNGILDLVVAESDSSTIGVLLGNGDGTFGYETEYALPDPPSSVVIDDFNHDGKPDIAAVMVTTVTFPPGAAPYLALLTGDGTGAFSAPKISNNPGFYSSAWNIASGDVNNDGLPDLLITGPGGENSQIYLNNGDGTFRPGETIASNGGYDTLLDGRLADINGDGCLDAVIADADTFVWVAKGDCTGHFTFDASIPMGDSNAAVRVVDINGDGYPDIVTSALPVEDSLFNAVAGNTLSVALGDGKGNFGTARNYVGTSQSYSIGVADFNGDGSPDFVTANNDTDTVTVYQNDKSGGFGFPQGVYAGIPGVGIINAPLSAVSFADLNGDGKPDAFCLDEGYSGEYFATGFLNDGTGKFSGPVSSDLGIAIPNNILGDHRLGNFRDSSHEDLIGIGLDQAFSGSSQFIFFAPETGNGTFAKGTIVTVNGADGILTTGDFNHDGKLDFIAVNGSETHTLTTFLGNGDGTFHALAPITFSDSEQTFPSRIYTGDFNRDGKPDVLIFTTANGYGTSDSSVWELDGNGDGTFQTPRMLFTGFQPFALADVNADGYADIARYDIAYPYGNNTLGPAKFTTYLGQADGTFSQSSSYAPYEGIPWDVQPFLQNGDPLSSSLVADLNGDGKPDEVAFQYSGYKTIKYAQILMGNGDGTFTPTFDVFPFYLWDYPVYAHNLDGSANSDMVNLVSGTSSLQVYKSGPAPALQIALRDEIVTGNASCGWVFADVASSSAQTVTLSSSVAGVSLPSSVTIPANAVSAQFCYALAANFDWHQVFDINAQLNGDTATAYASDSYSLGFSVALSSVTPAVIYAGQSTDPVTVTLTASQGYSSTVKLYCEGLMPGDSCNFSTNSLDVSSAGAATATVTFVTAPNAVTYGEHPFTVVADDGNIIHRMTATINVAALYMYSLASPLQSGVPGTTSTFIDIDGIPPYTMSCSGLPPGATCSFSGTSVPYPSSTFLTMTLAAASTTTPGSYPIQVTVASGPLTASQSTTLQVLNLSVTGPSANNDWVLDGGEQVVAITANADIPLSGSIVITCALDIGGTCSGNAVSASQTPQNAYLTIVTPAGTPTGQHTLTVTAKYGTVSQSFSFPFYVADFSGSLSTGYATMARGGTGTLTATLNATTDFVDSVTLACTGAAQISCSFDPASTNLTGGTPQTVSVALRAGDTAAATPPPALFPGSRLLALAMLLPFGLVCGSCRRNRSVLLMVVLGMIVVFSAIACGSGGGSGGQQSNNYAVKITATVPNSGVVKTLGTVNVTVTH